LAPTFVAKSRCVRPHFSRNSRSQRPAAAKSDGVGSLTETLKWDEPAYLTEVTESGSTIRLGRIKASKKDCAVLFNCRTTLVDTFRNQFPEAFAFEKDRAILLRVSGPLPEAPLSICLSIALTYHRRQHR
jgi:hypothetical protein